MSLTNPQAAYSVLRLQELAESPGFLMCVRAMNSASYACGESTLHIKPSPQPGFYTFNV